jgi:hypothetical protein
MNDAPVMALKALDHTVCESKIPRGPWRSDGSGDELSFFQR